jgi:hypothetical protein
MMSIAAVNLVRYGSGGERGGCVGAERRVLQMMAWGSFARDVPRRNLRSFSFVSGEKVYNLDSD